MASRIAIAVMAWLLSLLMVGIIAYAVGEANGWTQAMDKCHEDATKAAAAKKASDTESRFRLIGG